MRVGIDYRPALVNREGIGRYTRELVRGMLELGFAKDLGLFGYTLAPARFTRAELGLQDSAVELLRLRLPAKLTPWLLRKLNKGVDDLVGGCEIYHHTQPNKLDVRAAAEIVTVFDCIYALDAGRTDGPGFLDPEVASEMLASAKESLQRAKRILVPCDYVGAEVVMSLGAHPARVTVTPLGCDHVVPFLPPEGFEAPATPFILTVARVDARKNHVRILRAFERLVREGHIKRWIVAGPRGYGSEDFERALQNSPARAGVEWRQNVGDAELAKLYSQASVFVWPSLNEGFGLPPLEAMVCGTPVVTSHVTSMPEVCGDCAFLVEPTDEERIFEATRRLLDEPDLAEDFAIRGRARARQYTWRECAKSTLLAYRATLDDDGSEPKMQGLF